MASGMHCQVDSEQNQRDCQDLTQRIRAEHETKLGVRLTRELDKEAGEAVAGQENAGQQTRAAINAGTVGQDRKSVVEGKSVSVRLDHGGLRHLKKKKSNQQPLDEINRKEKL